MTARYLDWSDGRPDLAQVKAQGYAGVYRYICRDWAENAMPGKRLTALEASAIAAMGLDLGLHFEDSSSNPLGGYPAGLADGTFAGNYIAAQIPWLAGVAIHPAIDYDTAGTYPAVVDEYLRGFTVGLDSRHPQGVYGSFYVVDEALSTGRAVYGVQTTAWSHGNVSTRAHLLQAGYAFNGAADINQVLRTPLGTYLQGDDMSAADVAAINAHTDQAVANATNAIAGLVYGNPANPDATHGASLVFLKAEEDKILALLNPATLAAQIAAALPAGGITQQQIETALSAVLAASTVTIKPPAPPAS